MPCATSSVRYAGVMTMPIAIENYFGD
jgi:hypothetical protein